MCKLCEINPVYEFTNKRKLCKSCFINYFNKKVLYTVRKFKMIKKGDIISFKKSDGFKDAVLGEILKLLNDKIEFNLVKSQSKKTSKTATASSIDSEAGNIAETLIKGNVSELRKSLPVSGNEIKPLYLFLDEEVLLYAKLKNLKFVGKKSKKSKIRHFEDELEKKHPEVKRAIVNSLLKLN